MTYQDLFSQVEALFANADTTGYDGDFAVQINVIGEGEGKFYIAYKNGKLDVAPYEYNDRDATLIATAENVIKIADGSLNAVLAFTTGKLKVEGNVGKALELQKLIEIINKNSKKKGK